MDVAGEQFLARSAFAKKKNGRFGRGGALGFFDQAKELPVLGHNFAVLAREVLGQAGLFGAQRTALDRSAQDAFDLGIVTKLVAPADVESAIKELVAEGKPEKYRKRELPEKFEPYAVACSRENVDRLFSGDAPQGISEDLAARTAKVIGFKAPLALKMGNEIIDQQVGKSMPEAVEIELGRLNDIFSTADALEGLSNVGRKRPEFKGR